jgi:non-specific serine/threonine protein kinase/serine/threonine-protein kinase
MDTPSAARWRTVEELFHRASGLSADERVAQLQIWCGVDSELLAEVLDLLNSDSSVNRLIASLSPSDKGTLLTRETHDDPWLGTMVGAFRLDRLLGRGGMGVVYLATRTTKEFAQKVAVKLMSRHLQSTPAQSHFLLEIRALAQLEHKNIARLLDGGVTSSGLPYIAMEYIEGRRLDSFCDEPAISIEHVLQLMLQLCRAVDYVHRNLILHRDLKPANVMVTSDGEVIKLLDFGTLKLMGVDAAANSMMTQAGMRPVTVRYASPEHIRGDLTSTASDVYSLGMILYRLIAGSMPQEMEDVSIDRYLEYLKSQRITPPCQVAQATIKTRSSDGKATIGKSISASMARDLDAIVLKAIRFEPEERYVRAEALAADLSRVFENRPVLARTQSRLYKVQRFFRRNRLAAIGTAAASIVVFAGLAAMRWQANIAAKETIRAEVGIEEERKLAHLLFTDYFDGLKKIPGSIDAQRRAVTQAIAYLDNLNRITNSRNLRLESVEAYRRMALLQGDPYEQNIGDPNGALSSLDKAQALAQMLKSAAPNDTIVLAEQALVQRTRSEVLYGVGRTQEGTTAMRASVRFYDTLVSRPTATVAQLQFASNAYNGLGDELGEPGSAALGDYAAALDAYRKDIELSQRALQLNPNFILGRQSIAIAHNKMGQILVRTDPITAIKVYRQSIAEREALPAADKNSLRYMRGIGVNDWDLGTALAAARDYTAAIAAFEQGRAIIEPYAMADKMDSRAQHDLAVGLSEEASAYLDMLNPDLNASNREVWQQNARHAIQLLQKSLALQERNLMVNPDNKRWIVYQAYTQINLGTLEYESKIDTANGTRLAAAGVATARQILQVGHPTLEDLTYLVPALLIVKPPRLRDNQLTVQSAEQLVALDHRTTPESLLWLAQAYHAAAQIEKGNAAAKEGLALLAVPQPGDPITRPRKLLEIEEHPH